MDSKVAKEWMEELSRTANAKDFEAHMALISKQVEVFGFPGIEVIQYADWAAQCKHEFEQGILKSYRYDGVNVLMMMPGKVAFETRETVEATDGTVNIMNVEIVLVREDDEKWRVVQERVSFPEF